ncbi:DedA family protein [Companilactobacillus sp.]|uniref:DedA family protein n=1 Tax=Companilactobacillus sp. TaxID=2767905 RepID=UPI0025BB3EC4|nr:DedA family protein [Companilactobacillus sp.]MCH4010327.1 DedA family protein [Companilactobacillus sp.]MCH4051997.1 DedA family protein [Companilactobacillus sp.]MCH4078269.1 DedA family protein [Companilactobacillus sp.]MCH4126845.1 DedA family protein [Companilactobacillus sp.]MCH4132684.1 DedA family protein [Companilactobacillus sp.]
MSLVDFILHIDHHMVNIVNNFGIWTYLILFLIIFIETGVVILPFLPGDSLIFAAMALAANPKYGLIPWILFIVFLAAAVLGDSMNYEIGEHFGEFATRNKYLSKLINKEHLDEAHAFFKKHGGKTIAIGRFIPLIRTFVPFVAGSGTMHYGRFLKFNLLGGFLWVLLCSLAGFLFGNIPAVQEHFSIIIIGIVVISVIPIFITAIRNRKKPVE